MRQLLKRLALFCGPFRRHMLFVFGMIAASQLIGLLGPYLQGTIIDRLIERKPIRETFVIAAASFALVIVNGVLLPYLRERYELLHIDFKIRRYASKKTIEKIMSLSIGQHTSESSGVKQSVITKGQTSLIEFVQLLFYQILPMAIEVGLMIAALFIISPSLGCIVLAGTILFAACMAGLNIKFRPVLKRIEDMYHDDQRFQREVLQNAGLILTNAQEERIARECDQSIGRWHALAENTWLRFERLAMLRNSVSILTSFAVMTLGILYVHWGEFTPGRLFIVLQWTGNALGRVGMFGHLQRRFSDLTVSVRKYFALLDVEPDVKSSPRAVRIGQIGGRIEFRNVTLRYPHRAYIEDDGERKETPVSPKPALDDVNFVIEAGQTVALVGESGAGKTSVVYALLRAQDPENGRILVDGHDIRDLELADYRRKIGVVDQHVPLFDETLRYNITFGLDSGVSGATEEKLSGISEAACIDRFSNRLEKGFDTVIGERGIRLSGGERQRVGIARALMKDASILVFDEATSNLDAENEALIQESIRKISKGRTTIIIAHRLSTIREVDRVIVFDGGRVVGVGTHKELERSCPEYRRLIRHQVVVF